MIDTTHEKLFPLVRVIRGALGLGSESTARRWAKDGIYGFKLETLKIGGRRFTSHEAVARFVSRLNEIGVAEDLPKSIGEVELGVRGFAVD